MISENTIEICPLLFMRGRTFKNSFIIADEMQNSNPSQMKMLLTRIGSGTKLVITGDLAQTDIEGSNGLGDFLNKFTFYNKNINTNTNVNTNPNKKITNIKIINFSINDVERSEIVKNVLTIYDNFYTHEENIFNKNTTSKLNNKIDQIPQKYYYTSNHIKMYNNFI
jgi:phosphate starvation-inducible PhoH-like protein